MGRPGRFLKITLALALAGACSSSPNKAPRPDDVDFSSDGADGADGSMAGSRDGAVAAPADASIDFRDCAESAERFRAKSDGFSGNSLSLVSQGLDVHVAYLTPTCLGVEGNGTAHGVRYLHLQSTGAVTAPVDVAYADGASCVRVQHPALSSVEGAITIAYSAAPAGAWAVFERGLEAPQASQLSGERAPTDVTALESDQVAGKSWTAWAEDDARHTSAIYVARREGDAERLLFARDAGYHVTALALRGFPQVGRGAVRAALVFASDSASQAGVFLLRLDAEMKAIDAAPLRLSEATPGAVSLDLQARGVLYTSGSAAIPDLRFRVLSEQAKPVGDEVRITTANEHAAVGSLTPFTVGYAVAYRSVKPDNPERAWLRLSLIDPQGNHAGYRNLFETSASGGRVLVRTAVDGRLVLGFREVNPDGSSELQVARVTCGL